MTGMRSNDLYPVFGAPEILKKVLPNYVEVISYYLCIRREILTEKKNRNHVWPESR